MIAGHHGGVLGRWLDEHEPHLVAVRRRIHAHPELSGAEFATAALMAEQLSAAGLTPVMLPAGNGVICDVVPDAACRDVPLVAIRADLDALAMDDEKDVPYASRVPGVAHACGHDVHTTIALGLGLVGAHGLDGVGPVRLLFQPAEEKVPGGALDMLAAGALDGVAAVIGFHCEPKLEVGTVGLRSGPITSAADMMEVTLAGPGGHTARPERTVDLVSVAARLAVEWPDAVVAAAGGPDALKFVVGALNAGDAANVIPSHARLRASVRTPDPELWERIGEIARRELERLLDGGSAQWEFRYVRGVPPVVNDALLVDMVATSLVGLLGSDGVVAAEQSWGGDDFAWYAREVPGLYLRLGVRDPAATGEPLDLHAGCFDVDERAIGCGVETAAAVLTAWAAAHR